MAPGFHLRIHEEGRSETAFLLLCTVYSLFCKNSSHTPMRLLKLLLVVGLVTSLSACDVFEQRERTFDDDPKLEFFPLQASGSEADAPNTLNVEIQLIGPQRESDLDVSFSVDDSTTAEQGTHFRLPANTATIPANSSQTTVQIQVLDDTIDNGGETLQVFMSLDDENEVEPAENLKTFRLDLPRTNE